MHRSDSSGTTYVFTDWLNKSNAAWKASLGRSKAPNWPVGLGGLGNEGVATLIKQTPGAIGYIELNYLKTLGLPAAEVKNGSGEFVSPSIDSATAAAGGVEIPADFRVSLTGANGAGADPISSFTYLLVGQPVIQRGSGYLIIANNSAYARNLLLVPGASPSNPEFGSRISSWCTSSTRIILSDQDPTSEASKFADAIFLWKICRLHAA